MNEYQKQAKDFAEKFNVTMTSFYTGHRERFDDNVTATWNITLSRPDKKPYSFDYSDSINNSWRHSKIDRFTPTEKGLPPRIDLEKFMKSKECYQERFDYHGMVVMQVKPQPSLYDILACLEKSEIGSFEDFCADFGYSEDSISAMKTWQLVMKESQEVRRLFADCLEELQEIA